MSTEPAQTAQHSTSSTTGASEGGAKTGQKAQRSSLKMALALGSGGARGYAHIGVLRAVCERGYDITAISGCSMGALIGGLFAAGKMEAFADWVLGLGHFDIVRLLDISLSSRGAIRGEKVFSVLDELIGDLRIEDLPIDYTAVAADLSSQREVWFREGSLRTAIRASVAIPSVLPPVVMGGRLLVDGGLLNPVPIAPTISSHADVVLAVNLSWLDGKRVAMAADVSPNTAQAFSLDEPGDRFEDWFERVKRSARAFFDGEQAPQRGDGQARDEASPAAHETLDSPAQAQADDASTANSTASVGVLDLINMSFETMQGALTQYKLAGYPPDILVNVPKRVCKTFEYHKAEELITLGYKLAVQALDAYEAT